MLKNNHYGQPIYNNQQIFELLYTGKINDLNKIIVEDSNDISKLEQYADIKLQRVDESQSISEFDSIHQAQWLIPDQYKKINMLEWLLAKCSNDTEVERVCEEYLEFESRNLIDLLRWLIYFVDQCRSNNVLWGVGRGSSTASYILYLIGVHRINSIKYNLNYQEFLR